MIEDEEYPISMNLPSELRPRIRALRELAERNMHSLPTAQQRNFCEGAHVYLCQLDVDEDEDEA